MEALQTIEKLLAHAVEMYEKKLRGDQALLITTNASHEDLIALLNAKQNLSEAEDAFYAAVREYSKNQMMES